MSRTSNTVNLFVIFASPENYGGPSSYCDKEGNVTIERSRAVRFNTRKEALAFAKQNDIDLSGIIAYVGLEEFPKSEVY